MMEGAHLTLNQLHIEGKSAGTHLQQTDFIKPLQSTIVQTAYWSFLSMKDSTSNTSFIQHLKRVCVCVYKAPVDLNVALSGR